MKDIIGLAGLLMVVAGFAVIWWPLALIVGGAMMTTAMLLIAYADVQRGPDERGED